MAFVAECMFCRLMLRGIPDHLLGRSIECPRCRNHFTLAPMAHPGLVSEPTPAAPVKPFRADGRLWGHGQATMYPPEEKTPRVLPAPTVPPPSADYPGLGSFVLGSAAFFAAAVLHEGLLTLVLGLAGFSLGLAGYFLRSAKQGRRTFLAVGLAVSLSAVLIAVLLPHWFGLSPLFNPPAPRTDAGPAVVSLSSQGGFRRAAAGEELRVDASQDALHYGDVRLRVRSVAVGLVPFEPIRGQRPPAERGLVIGLRIMNAGITRKVRYTGWGGDSATENRPLVRDGQGKSYPVKTFPHGWVVQGRTAKASIPPGKFVDDVLVFEAPPRTIDSLRLELPASAVDAEGELRLDIPKRMIAYR